MKTISFISIISGAGIATLVANIPILTTAYVAVTTLIFASVAVGGVLKYTSQEIVDFKDVYREKDRLQKMKIEDLTLKIIDLEKEKLQYIHESASNKSAVVYDTVIVNGGLET